MISVLFLCSILWLGFVLDEELALTRGDFPLRLAAAGMLGCFWGTWLVYLLAWCFGFHVPVLLGATGIILLGNSWAWRNRRRDFIWFSSLFRLNRPFWRVYWVFPAVVTAFFVFGLWTDRDGNIFYQGNFTDLAFHMGTVSAFLEQTRFPPLNPQSAAAKLSYHFMADFFSAILCKGGFTLYNALKLPMVGFAFALAALLCHFFDQLLKARTAAVCACVLFLFGHIGVFNLIYGLAGYPVGNIPLSFRSWTGIEDHLTFPYFNFLNVLVDFFQPQLAFLFGFPFALLILLLLFRKFSRAEPTDAATYFLIGAVALLPLFHMHSFLVLAPLTALTLLAEWWKPPQAAPSGRPFWQHPAMKAGAVLVAAVAVALQFAFILSQKKTAGFSGFDVTARLAALNEIPDFLHAKRLWYWIRVAGLPFILGLAGFFLPPTFQCRARDPGRRANLALLACFAVTSGFFVIINFYRFTPSWGDSNKFFLYWDLLLCLYAGRLLARMWAASRSLKALACLLLALGSVVPFVVEWQLRIRRGPSTLFTASEKVTADWIRLNTPRDAVFLTANSYTHYVTALAGRRVVNGSYTRETGFADDEIEHQVAQAFRQANPGLITGVKVTHMVIGPEEKNAYHVSRAAMTRWHKLLFEQSTHGQRYSVYEVRDVSPEEFAEDRRKQDLRGYVWLSELDPASVKQFGTLQFDESFDLTTLTLDGVMYPAGLGTHAPSDIRYELNGKYASFESDIGVDDTERGGPGSVVFRVSVDDKIVYSSHVMRAGAPRESVKIDLTGANVLHLIADDAGDGNHGDHADWAGAKLIMPPGPANPAPAQ